MRGQNPIKGSGFAGTLSPEQRARMYNSLSAAQKTAYDGMTPAQKTIYESDFADAHWDIVSGTSTSTVSATDQAYLSATERALGLTFGTISTAMANNNQQQLLQIQQAGAQEILRIQAQLQRDLAPTQRDQALRDLANLQHTDELLNQQRNQTGQMVTYGLAAAAVLAGLYLWSQQARKNPVVTRSGHKVFIPLRLLPRSAQAAYRSKHPRRRAA